MGGLEELSSSDALKGFISDNKNVVVTFSAHWCGPCKASKPTLQNMAQQYASDVSKDVKFGIVYESDIGDEIHQYAVRAFPTYALFQSSREVDRVEGVNFEGIKAMIEKAGCQNAFTGGQTLASESTVVSPEEARALRLAKLGAGAPSPAPATQQPAPAANTETTEKSEDVQMEDATASTTEAEDSKPEATDPTANLDPEALKNLTENMGFSLLRAQKGLLYGNGGSVEGAVEWLMEHQDDVDIDQPIPAVVAQSYKCNECGKILSNMANLELHANKTGHSDFEESTQKARCLTAEEKAAKILEIKDLLKAKRAEREEAEKVDNTEREKARRFMGKEMAKTREQMEIEQRKREAIKRKQEKQAAKLERQRIKAELEKDKRERLANNGKLSSKLGVDGYNPDGIQYDVDIEGKMQQESTDKPKKARASAAKIDEYIKKVSSYRAGGDGGKCLKILKVYVGNLADNPDEAKFRTINTENKAFKTKVKPFIGAKNLLLAIGFKQEENGTSLVMSDEDLSKDLLMETKNKLEAALASY